MLATLCAALLAATARLDASNLLQVPEPQERPAARWRGQYCTAIGCAGAPAKPWSVAIGFGGAALAAIWIGRRRKGGTEAGGSEASTRRTRVD